MADEKRSLFRKMGSDSASLGVSNASFNRCLEHVVGFTRAAELDGNISRSPNGVSGAAFDALKLYVRSLDPDTQEKLRALVRAGHDAVPIQSGVAAIVAERVSGAGSVELFARGCVELEDLRRGHAVARATAFDLEIELAAWGSVREPQSLEERVWLRFGCELARSRLDEWTCFAVVDSRDRLEKLYLRRGKARWWSFAALLDRPSERALDVPRSARSGRRGLIVLPVQVALERSCRPNLGAVRRASSAVSARFALNRSSLRRIAASETT